MEIEASQTITIAPGCPSPCNFLEFVEYTQRQPKKQKHKLDPGQTTIIGSDPWPDPLVGVSELGKLTANGKPFIPNTDPKELFSTNGVNSLLQKTGKPSLNLATIMTEITDKIQEARRILNDNVPEDGLTKVRTAITGIHQVRLKENGADLIQTLNNYLKNVAKTPTRVVTRTVTAVDGSKFKDVDIPATSANDSDFQKHWTAFKDTYIQDKARTGLVKTVREHFNAAQGVQDVSNRVHGHSSC